MGQTPRAAVVDALASDPIVAARIVGASLSKVEIDKLELFDNHAAYGYANEYMSRYYQTAAGSGDGDRHEVGWREAAVMDRKSPRIWSRYRSKIPHDLVGGAQSLRLCEQMTKHNRARALLKPLFRPTRFRQQPNGG